MQFACMRAEKLPRSLFEFWTRACVLACVRINAHINPWDAKPRVIMSHGEGSESAGRDRRYSSVRRLPRVRFLWEEVSRNFLASEIALGVSDPPHAATFTWCADHRNETVACNTAVPATVFHFHPRSGWVPCFLGRCVSFPHKTFIYSNDREAFHGFSEDWH